MAKTNIKERENVFYRFIYTTKTDISAKQITSRKRIIINNWIFYPQATCDDRHYCFKMPLLFWAQDCASLIQVKRVELVDRGLVAEKEDGSQQFCLILNAIFSVFFLITNCLLSKWSIFSCNVLAKIGTYITSFFDMRVCISDKAIINNKGNDDDCDNYENDHHDHDYNNVNNTNYYWVLIGLVGSLLCY